MGTFPAEILVNLLLRLDRPKEALAVARKHLARLGDQRVSCPSIVDLCRQTGDYQTLAEVEGGNRVIPSISWRRSLGPTKAATY